MVFVNGDRRRRLRRWLAGFPDHIGSYRPERLHEVVRVQFDARCNWKLFVENHVDVYHLWYLHARSLGAYDHQQFEWDAIGPHWVSYEPGKEGVERKRPHVGSTPIAGLAERDRVGIGAHMLFPNTLFATESEFFMSYVAKPLAPDRSVIDVRIRAEPGADVEMLVAAAKEFMLEDVSGVRRHPGNGAFEPLPGRPARPATTNDRSRSSTSTSSRAELGADVMTLAPKFVGAWKRRSIAIDGGAHGESARVLWLQAGDAFADLRIPDRPARRAPTRSPASPPTRNPRSRGTTPSTGTVDSRATTAASSNADDEEMIERGEFERDGCCHAYEEIWQRVDHRRGRASCSPLRTRWWCASGGTVSRCATGAGRADEFDVRHARDRRASNGPTSRCSATGPNCRGSPVVLPERLDRGLRGRRRRRRTGASPNAGARRSSRSGHRPRSDVLGPRRRPSDQLHADRPAVGVDARGNRERGQPEQAHRARRRQDLQRVDRLGLAVDLDRRSRPGRAHRPGRPAAPRSASMPARASTVALDRVERRVAHVGGTGGRREQSRDVRREVVLASGDERAQVGVVVGRAPGVEHRRAAATNGSGSTSTTS